MAQHEYAERVTRVAGGEVAGTDQPVVPAQHAPAHGNAADKSHGWKQKSQRSGPSGNMEKLAAMICAVWVSGSMHPFIFS